MESRTSGMVKDLSKLTIIMPVYERYRYFEKAAESILNQTIECNFLVVDNASSHNKFRDWCYRNNIQYYRNNENIGMFPNWNRGVEFVKTEFFMILGDDDFLDREFVQRFLDAYYNVSNFDIWFSDFKLFDHSSKTTREHNHVLPFGSRDGTDIIEFGVKYGLGFPIISSVIKKNVFQGFYEKEHGSNDWLWLYSNAKNLKFFGDSKILLNYGFHVNQDSKKNDTKIHILLSTAYIMSEVIPKGLEDSALKMRSKKMGRARFQKLISKIDEVTLKKIIKNDSVYGQYLIQHLSSIDRFYLKLPQSFRLFLFKLLRKINYIVDYRN